MTTKKHTVGLVYQTIMPHLGLTAIMARRSEFSFEGGKIAVETWPNLVQAVIHGGIEPGEDPKTALIREAGEELNQAFREYLESKWDDVVQRVRQERTTRIDTVFTLFDPDPSILLKVSHRPPLGSLVFVTPSKKVRTVDPEDQAVRRDGVSISKIIMHPYDKEAMEMGFETYRERARQA